MTTMEVRDLRYVIDGRTIFDDVSFTVRSGDAMAIRGPSGSGKTSLLALLAGLTPPTSGEIFVDDAPLRTTLPPGFALVLQGYGLMSLLTAQENVEVALRAHGYRPKSARVDAASWLAKLGAEQCGPHLAEDLSGGQRQRVAVARALALKPTVLIADEPTAEQDAASRALVMGKLLDVCAQGGILFVATHDAAVADLCNGSVQLHGSGQLPGSHGSEADRQEPAG